ncbi:Frataxin-like protein [Plesiocystis pacifica SIR-1]|uniref:Frataxin-like protein n=1 Tax=Plesiocystis pacifica SIR-1 TaxID=391625 RepID=A6G5L3_9BACT|nr:iron donor protein CyaY [Plesiocystis pacifica]EDM78794.1 Frataxin-like protein [Plesiocystis pacifica SIR-1]
MDRKTFHTQSSAALRHIDEILGDLEHDELDVDLAGDVLTLAFAGGDQFIINAHSAAEQVWMAAGTTAWHFDWVPDSGKWIARKTDEELMATVSRVVGAKLGLAVEL